MERVNAVQNAKTELGRKLNRSKITVNPIVNKSKLAKTALNSVSKYVSDKQ